MSRCVQSTGPRSAASRLAFVALLAFLPAGCAQFGLPFGQAGATGQRADATITNSIVKAASATGGVDASDWEAVRRTLATELVANRTASVEWNNPDTGSSGTISGIRNATEGSASCRYFATTLSDIHGVRRYRGEICQDKDRWRLTRVAPDDALLS